MSSSQHALILRTAIHYLRTTVKADRAIALYDGYAYSHGFEEGALWDRADISQGIVAELLAKRRPALVADALAHPVFAERTSTVLSNIGGVMFLPLLSQAGVMRGFLYLDQTRLSKIVLTQAILDRIQGYVEETLQPMLHSLREDLTWEDALRVHWLPQPAEMGQEGESGLREGEGTG